MTDLLPVLKPLKGEIGNNASLSDCEYDHDDKGKPTISFSIAIANPGRGPLHITLGAPQDDGGRTVAPAKQRIFNDEGGYREIDVGFFERHQEPDHVHWHYAGLASMELVNKDGKVVATSKKEGYCLADSFQYDSSLPKSPPTAYFDPIACIQKTEVGLSVGWADHYDSGTEEQYIEIENVPSGNYQLRLTVNKTQLACDIIEAQSVEVTIDKENEKAWAEKSNKINQ